MLRADTTAHAQEHWALRPLVQPALPERKHAPAARTAIDRFVFARLEAEGLAPSDPADRGTLIRRVTLDLLGLPPAPEDVQAFLADDNPQAYDRLVDRLLASPQYGERWARPWLDLCHYGDSDGHLTDQLRPVAWRYRDWLIQALNANLPFDQFTIEQLAGDLLPGATQNQQIATGFLRQTLSNREGGADLEEYRVAQVIDRTNMVGTIWLGLTLGCARCHDHKYDPVTQAEYFGLYAMFDNAAEVNIDAPLAEEHDAWQAARLEYERRRADLLAPVRTELDDLQRDWEHKVLYAARNPGEDHIWDRQWELLGLIWGGNLGEGQLEGTEICQLPWNDRTPRQQADLTDYFLSHGSLIDSQRFERLKLNELQQQLQKLKGEFPKATRAPVIREALVRRQTCIHERGDFRVPGAPVEPDTPACLPLLPESDEPARLTLARWLVAPENPLTSRVTVNRVWQEFFGRGLVATSNDFGLRGDRPTHPELLDWLAGEFIATGWNLKALHRLIVTSAVYRQSSHPRPDLLERDPENLLLARQNSLRVTAEAVRDSALAASGLLSRTLGGPSVKPPQPERVTMEAFGSNDWKPSSGGDRFRRSLYTFVLRTSPFAQTILFDAPAPIDVCTRRPRSNTPLQALTLLNDEMFQELARGLARRLLELDAPADSDRLSYAVWLCLGREPTRPERERFQTYVDLQRRELSAEPSRADLLTGGVQPPAGTSPIEFAAWTNLASVLFNLHEFIVRD